jgi:hypothetical protein
VIKSQLVNLMDEPKFIYKTPLDKGLLCRYPKQGTFELNGNNPQMHVDEANAETDAKKRCKGTRQQCTDLGFKNKKVGRLISRKLRNQNDTHLSLIDPIEIDEGSDPKIEDFLVREDPNFRVPRGKLSFLLNRMIS